MFAIKLQNQLRRLANRPIGSIVLSATYHAYIASVPITGAYVWWHVVDSNIGDEVRSGEARDDDIVAAVGYGLATGTLAGIISPVSLPIIGLVAYNRRVAESERRRLYANKYAPGGPVDQKSQA